MDYPGKPGLSCGIPSEWLRGRVLVAEGDPSLRKRLQDLLAGLGVQVLAAGGGPEAMSVLEREPLDAVLLDPNLPAASLPGLLEALQGTPGGASLPVLLLVADPDGSVVSSGGVVRRDAGAPGLREALAPHLSLPVGDPAVAEAHLDRVRARQLMEVLGGEEALAEFAATFREDSQRRVLRIREALDAGDRRLLAGQAHDLKTNAGTLGLVYLARVATVLEQETQAGEASRLGFRFARLEAALAEALRLLDEGLV